PELGAQQRAHVRLAEPGLLVDLAGDGVAGAAHHAGPRPGHQDPARRDPARPLLGAQCDRLARRTSRSRSSRTCLRLTGSSVSPTSTVQRPESSRSSLIADSETRWLRCTRTNPAPVQRSLSAARGMRTRWLPPEVWSRA